jgi:prepilin-type N-terminal cleavage/methylation domain-containing protein
MTAPRPTRRCRGDAGVTLIELLATIAISTIVIGAASMALIVAFKTTGATADSFAESNDAELISMFFVPDAQSATTIGQTLTTGCSEESSADVLRMQGPGFSLGYRFEGTVLTRWICESGTARTHIIGRHLKDVIPWSTGGHQVALTIVAESGHSFSLVGTQRTGTVDLPPPTSPNILPVSDISADCTHLRCLLDGAGSTDSDGAIAAYAWDLGDGTTASTAQVDHLYAFAATFTVRLTVTDTSGGQATTTTTVEVAANQPPTASFTASCVGRTCTVDGSASIDPDGALGAFEWDWGDGSAHESGVTLAHTYATVGPKTITLTVIDSDGAIATATQVVTPANQAPAASFTLTCAGRTCNVDASASADPDGTITSYSWIWGDGSANGTGETAAHTYTTSGPKTVTLTVTDNEAAIGTTTRNANVNMAPTASFTISTDGSGTTCNLAVCAVTSTSTDGDGTIASYAWSWGDATADGSDAATSHTYTALGSRTITLTVTDDDGATASISTAVTPPVLTFTTKNTSQYRVTLAWAPASLSGTNVDIYRNGSIVASNQVNDGDWFRASNNKNNVNGTYKVCERTGTVKRCTNSITAVIP